MPRHTQDRKPRAWVVATHAAAVMLLALGSASVVLVALLALAGRAPQPLDVARWLAAGTGVAWLTAIAAQLRAAWAARAARGRPPREEALAALRAF